MEVFAWAFVFISWAVWRCREESDMTWYIIGIKSYNNGSLNLDEIDAVLCECSMDALRYAKQRYRTKYGQSLYAEACLTMQHVNRAKQLHSMNVDNTEDWTDAEWKEFCSVETYYGDQDKYLKTWTK